MRWPRAMGAVNVAGTSGVLSNGDTNTHGIVMKHEGGLNCLD
jgi:hypothetical protein